MLFERLVIVSTEYLTDLLCYTAPEADINFMTMGVTYTRTV